ncbi:MAG: IS200/IS605 family transposase [Acidobacteria bacterium]|nr:IS200/IS605 family transposase [Acidobacteriota bacterium]
MAQTHVRLYIHVVFSTKGRFAFITPEIESELFAYIGGILNKLGCKLLAANGTSNHIHLLISLNKHANLPGLIGTVKRESSKWLKGKSNMLGKFGWQDGYAAFSVGHSQLPAVTRYIKDQKIHHAERLFEDEMRTFYKQCEIEFDEQFVWG